MALVPLVGCALPVSIPLGPLAAFGSDADESPAVLVTGSIGPVIEGSDVSSRVGAEAWPALRAAVSRAIDRGEDGESFLWRSEHSGLSGMVTLVKAYFGAETVVCRRLTITIERRGIEEAFEAEACQGDDMRWNLSPAIGEA